MDQLWTDLLNFLNQLVSPDWGALIALLPLSLAALIVLYLVWVLTRFMTAGPKRRKPVLHPVAPEGIHMPGPSYSPILGAVGMALLLFGIVFPGPLLVAGVGALVFALVYWLREGMRDYEHTEHPQTALVVVGPHVTPPGIHLPGPSFRPILASIAMAVLLFSLVFGGWLYVAGIGMLAISLIQWLGDARREYKGVEIADRTGHLPADPRPGFPRKTFAVFALLFFGALFLNAGILPPKNSIAGPAPSAGASPTAPGGGGGSGGPQADLTITAANVAFVGTTVTAPADKPFTIRFQNNDAGIPHNVAIREGSATGAEIWKGEIFPGVDSRIYQVAPLKPGSYTFICDVHPTMTGQITVQ